MHSYHTRQSALAIATLRLAPTTFVGHCGNATPEATRIPRETAIYGVLTARGDARLTRRRTPWMATFTTHLVRRAATILSRRS